MAYVSVKYRQLSFEENPGLITWIQLFLIRYIDSIEDRPAWTSSLKEEWIMNSEVEIYKYFFDETLRDDSNKIAGSVSFLNRALEKINSMTIEQFVMYIEEDINPTVDFERLRNILLNVKLMLEGENPIKR